MRNLKTPSRLASLFLTFVLLGVTGCGGSGTGTTATPSLSGVTAPPVSSLATNAIAVTVDAGPAATAGNVNRLYADVTICEAGNATNCQTIDHVLVDTGSTGLRILASVLSPALNLSRATQSNGLPLLNCAQFVDGSFAWGPVAKADLRLSAKLASNIPIQIIADATFKSSESECSFGNSISSVAALGAKGIIGLSLSKEDCGSGCAFNANNGFYYTCTSSACNGVVGVAVSSSQQLKNPVSLFATDNNGFIVDLPAVSAPAAAGLTGSLIFGIGTQANNQFVSGTILTTNSLGYFTTVIEGRSLRSSFADTGSNGLYFDSSTVPLCADVDLTGFYCPATQIALTATIVGANGLRLPISFSIGNASELLRLPGNTVFPTLGGDIGDSRIFDWGLPFFYGRRIYHGIEGETSVLGTGPLYAL